MVEIEGVFGWGEWGSEIEIEMGDSHSNRLVRRSPISIPISGWYGNGSIYIKLRGCLVRNRKQNGNENRNGLESELKWLNPLKHLVRNRNRN